MPHVSFQSCALILAAAISASSANAEEITAAPETRATPVKAMDETPRAGARAWDTYFGGVVAGRWTARVPIQFGPQQYSSPALTMGISPAVGLSHAFTDMIELGLEVAIDFPTQQENDQWQTFGAGLFTTIPLRVSLLNTERLTAAIRFAPGFGFFRNNDTTRNYYVPLQLGVFFGYRLSIERFTLGVGLDSPMYIAINPNTGAVGFVAPILLGPVVELRVTSWISIFADVKVGVAIESTVPQTYFSQRAAVGISANF